MKIRNWVILAASICLTVLGLPRVLRAKQPTSLAAFRAELSSRKQISDKAANTKLVTAHTRLSFKLFSEILKQQSNENIFISPVGVATALAITYNGANGQTRAAMAETLELQGMSLQEINQANAAVKTTLKNLDPGVQLAIANSLWTREGESFKPNFLQAVQDFYQADVQTMNFGIPTALSTINTWVKQNTNGKIDKIVDEIEPDTVFLLLNAIYFKGNWTYPFPKEATEERPFTRLDGTPKLLPMMRQELEYVPYYENDIFQAIGLPYGEGRLSMYIFLPKQGVNLKTFYESLNAENWQKWIDQIDTPDGSGSSNVLLRLPRFRVEYSRELKDVLKDLGMEIAFSRGADFSEMTVSPLWLDHVKHKTFVEVNEDGTEAAAVTEVAGVRSVPIELTVDRPFFFVIRDNQTKTILFMGSIVEPKED